MTENEAPKKLFIRSKGVSRQKLAPLQVLQTFFSKYGIVVKITYGNKDCTIAFVSFLTAEQAKAAFDAINGSKEGDASNGVNLGRTLFVDFAVEEGAKPVHVKAHKPAPALRPAPLESPKSAHASRPAHLETSKPAPSPRPIPLETPKLDLSQKSFLNIEKTNIPMVYIFQGQKSRIMSKPALGVLFDLGSSPETKFQGDIPVQMFGNEDVWVIPHPEHPTSTQDCQKAYDSGKYSKKITVNIPREVLTSKKFWID